MEDTRVTELEKRLERLERLVDMVIKAAASHPMGRTMLKILGV